MIHVLLGLSAGAHASPRDVPPPLVRQAQAACADGFRSADDRDRCAAMFFDGRTRAIHAAVDACATAFEGASERLRCLETTRRSPTGPDALQACSTAFAGTADRLICASLGVRSTEPRRAVQACARAFARPEARIACIDRQTHAGPPATARTTAAHASAAVPRQTPSMARGSAALARPTPPTGRGSAEVARPTPDPGHRTSPRAPPDPVSRLPPHRAEASPAPRGGAGDAIASAARHYLSHPPPAEFRDDCSGFVMAAHARAGVPVSGNTRSLWEDAEAAGRVFRGRPRPGDLAFFDDTYDRNRNGRRDDPLSHIAVVIDVEADGTVVMAQAGTSRGRNMLRMNLDQPRVRRAPDGRVLNDWLRRRHRGETELAGHLAGELFRCYARAPHAPSTSGNAER